jgi:DNA segregation ATPase FtsK/SpoIIIE-like protein
MFKKNITQEDLKKLELKYEVLLDEYNALLNEVNHLKATKKNLINNKETSKEISEPTTLAEDDPLYPEVIEYAISTGQISASLIQRRFSIGYNRAARIMDDLEEKGFVGPSNGSKPREVILRKGEE